MQSSALQLFAEQVKLLSERGEKMSASGDTTRDRVCMQLCRFQWLQVVSTPSGLTHI